MSYPASAGTDKCLFHLPPFERANREVSQADFHEFIQEMVRSHGVIVLFNTELDTINLSQIDTSLLDMPPHREFNKSELANHADVSRKSVHNHIDLLLELDVLVEIPETVPTRYHFVPESDVSQALIQLDSAVNAAGPYSAD